MLHASDLLEPSASPIEVLAFALHNRAQRTRGITRAVASADHPSVMDAVRRAERSRAEVDEAWQLVRMGPTPPQEALGILRDLAGGCELAERELAAELARDGRPTLDAWLRARAPFDPVRAVDDMFGGGDYDPRRDLALAVGPRCEDVLRELSRRGQRRVVWFDPGTASVPAGLGETQVVIARDPDGVEAATWAVQNPPPVSVRCVAPPDCDRKRVDDGMRRAVEVLRLRKIFELFAKRYGVDLVRRGLRNARRVATLPSASRLDGVLRGKAAVVVAAGPSLDRNIHLLKGLQGKVAILAMNQTVRALRRAGVRPDVVLAGDWGNLAPHFEGVAAGEIGALGLATVVAPDLFDVPAERTFTFGASPWIEQWLFDMMGENATLHARGSVSFSLLELALRMGCETVAFIGLDLALQGTKYYAEGAADGGAELVETADGTVSMRSMAGTKMKLAASGQEEDMKRVLDAEYRVREVPGWGGGTVKTMADLHAQLVAMRAHVREALGRARMVNATEGGAFIEGMEHIPLAELIAQLPLDADAPEDAIRARVTAALDAVDAPARLARLRDGLARIDRELPRAIDAVRITERELARLGNRVQDTPAYRKARERWSQRTRSLPVEHFMALESGRLVEDALSAKDLSVASLRRTEREVFARYRETAVELAEAIHAALPALSPATPV